jgi:hypothetical protein
MLLIETYYSTADKASSKSKYNNMIDRLTAQQLTKQAANPSIAMLFTTQQLIKQAANPSTIMLLIQTYYSTADKAGSKSKYNNIIDKDLLLLLNS